MKKKRMILAVVALVLAFAVPAFALTDTGTLNATASIAESCTVGTIGDIAFGTYASASNSDANGSVQFTCVKNTTYGVYISAARSMTGATYSDTLNFELYTDVTRLNAWSSASPGETGTAADGNPITSTIYGRVASGQTTAGADTYSGNVTITVEY